MQSIMQLHRRKIWRLLLSDDVYGLLPYESVWRKRSMSDEMERARNFVYGFKKRGSNKALIQKIILGVAAEFGCEQILAVPSSDVGGNELQKMFGIMIETTEKSEKAKYLDGSKNYESWALRFDNGITKKKALLVDDVVSSGRTIEFFACRLKRMIGMQIVKFAIGVSTKREHTESDISIRIQGDRHGYEDVLDMDVGEVDFSKIL